QPSWLGVEVRVAEAIHFVGKTDPREGAADALGAVEQRRRNPAPRAHLSKPGEGLPGQTLELGVEGNVDSRLRVYIVEDSPVALVAVFPEDEPLETQLNPLRVPRPGVSRGNPPSLVVDRSDPTTL